jgi:hypothetical protein
MNIGKSHPCPLPQGGTSRRQVALFAKSRETRDSLPPKLGKGRLGEILQIDLITILRAFVKWEVKYVIILLNNEAISIPKFQSIISCKNHEEFIKKPFDFSLFYGIKKNYFNQSKTSGRILS